MAIEHIRIRTYSRAKGHSALAAAAYRGGYLLLDPRSGAKHDYRGRAGIIQSRCLAPNGSPSWADDPQALWSAAEAAEHRKNSTVCRDFNIALPHELDDVKRWGLTLDVAHRLIERYGFAVQASHHRPTSGDERYFYAHLLATTRRMEAAGLTQKTRVLDGRINGKGEVEWILQMVKQSIREHLAQHAGSVGASNSSAVCEATSTQGESFLTREQTRFEALLARYREQGRLLNTPEGHTAEQARRDHETRVSSQKAALGAHGLDGGGRSLSGDMGAEARLKAPLDLSALPDKH